VKNSIKNTLIGIEKLFNHLSKRKEIETSKIVLLGASLGAPFATLAAAKLPSLNALVLVHSFGNVPQVITRHLQFAEVPKLVAWPLAYLAWFYVDLPSPEQAAMQFREGQKILLIQAKEDRSILKEDFMSLKKALDQSKADSETQWMPGDHLKPGENQRIQKIVNRVLGWMERNSLTI